jgi:hypothetical protein
LPKYVRGTSTPELLRDLIKQDATADKLNEAKNVFREVYSRANGQKVRDM